LAVARIPGVGKVTQAHLTRFGIQTVGDLRSLPLEKLLREFGRFGLSLYRRARGIDETPVEPEQPVKSVSSEDTFPEDLPLSALPAQVERLAARTWQARLKTGRTPRTVVLKLKTAQFQILTRSLTPDVLPDSLEGFIQVASGLLQRVNLPEHTRYRLLGVGLAGFCEPEPCLQEAILFDSEPR